MKYTSFFLKDREVNLTKLDFGKGRSWDWRRQGFLCEFSFSKASNHRKYIWSRNDGSSRIRNGEWKQWLGDACRPGNKHLIPRKVKPSYGGIKKTSIRSRDDESFRIRNGEWRMESMAGAFWDACRPGNKHLIPRKVKPSYWWTFIQLVLSFERKADGSFRILNGEWRMEFSPRNFRIVQPTPERLVYGSFRIPYRPSQYEDNEKVGWVSWRTAEEKNRT